MLHELRAGALRNPIWFGAVATITGVQAFFGWEFWGAISREPAHQLALRALGLSFVAGEVVALDMASRAELNHEPKRAAALRSLWVVLALTTFSADINALSRVLQEGDAPRAAAVAAFDANQAHMADLERQIDRADDPYDNALLSVPAYDAAIAGKRNELAAARSGRARLWRVLQLQDQLTDLQTARAAAVEVAGWQAELERLRRAPESHAARPKAEAVEFQPFAEFATGAARLTQGLVGQRPTASVNAEEVREGMAWIATIAMKLMLTFGIWVGLQRGRGTGTVVPNTDTPEAPPTSPRDGDAPTTRPATVTARRPHAGPKTARFGRRHQRFGR